VRPDAMADQRDKEPLQATAEAGRVMIAAIVEGVTHSLGGMLDGTNVAPIPPFQE
jgi:creatinine amidohydrolase